MTSHSKQVTSPTYLNQAGCQTVLVQDDDLGYVCHVSDDFDADIFVSLHCNAFNTQARGTETLYKSFNGQRLANDDPKPNYPQH